MTAPAKAKRGRPFGDGGIDDERLRAIAILRLSDPAISIAAAARKGCGPLNDAEIRRLQDKWKKRGNEFMSEVRSKREAEAMAAAEAAIKEVYASGVTGGLNVGVSSISPTNYFMPSGMDASIFDRINEEQKYHEKMEAVSRMNVRDEIFDVNGGAKVGHWAA
ncbi:hypothetical protein [Sphingomonas sp. IC081]|uniref:hypothetical protein n=1 Tax=Sphingomonas sp. IC081 TaxID=304378 RepID=UPI00115870BD|nr:hypothetical protein [Sphingomonas sp. IC081]QDK32691.1 hypothetical protein DM450_07820 [Sphingomonas sp. IC081]